MRTIQSTLEFKNSAGVTIIARPRVAMTRITAMWPCWSGCLTRTNTTYRARPNMIPFYIVRHLAGEFEELCCFRQLEDESAALYFNIVHGAKVRRRFTTQRYGEQCADYVLISRATGAGGLTEEREIALFDAS